MGQLSLLRSMLVLTEHRLALCSESGASADFEVGTDLPIEPDSPEALFLAYLRSLEAAELRQLRLEICAAALRTVNASIAEMERGG